MSDAIENGSLREAIEAASIDPTAQPFVVAVRDGKVVAMAVDATVTHTPRADRQTGKQDEATTLSLVTAAVQTIVAAVTFGVQRKAANACHNRGSKDNPSNTTKAMRDKSRKALQAAFDKGDWKVSRSDRPTFDTVIEQAMRNISAKMRDKTKTDLGKVYRKLDLGDEAQAAALAKIVAEAERLQDAMVADSADDALADVPL